MVISTREKRHKAKNDKKKVSINFDLSSLTLMCNYVLSENRNIKRAQFMNLGKLIDMLDMDKYINDDERYKRIIFIKRGLEARLEKNLQDNIMILKYINGGILDSNMLDVSELKDMSNAEIDWINETVSNAIKYAYIYERSSYMQDLWARFNACDYRSIGAISSEIESATVDMNNAFRKARAQSYTERTFSLSNEAMESSVTDAWQETTSKYRKLVTGMQGFNAMIGGGFENTRVYLLLGITGVGKSMTMLDIAYQIKKYNTGYKTKDPTKRPCIVILTMENTITETIQRLFQMCTGEDFTKQSSPQEAIDKMRREGELYLSDASPIDIIVKYRPNKSEDTGYLYTLVDDLEDEGYETICLMQDHAKRIRSTERHSEIRLELGDVINEMSTFAKIKDIPVITDSHLNRAGATIIDANSGTSKADLTRLLGKNNIGESLLMLDNVDESIIVNNEYDKNGVKHMVFKVVKTRVKIFKEYICQPYDMENTIKLVEDIYSPVPIFKETLYEAPVMNTTMPNVADKNSRFVTAMPIDEDKSDNIYKFSSRYSSMPVETEETDKIVPFTFDRTLVG